MDFKILGTVEVHDAAGRPVDLGGPLRRTLLTALLLRANQTVRTDTLIDRMWDGRPPRSAATTVHSHLSRLRSRLAATGPDGEARILRDPAGYRLRVAPGELDADRFTDHLALAAAAEDDGRPEAAAAEYTHALRLWRGPALADIGAAFARTRATALDEHRTAAAENHLAHKIDAGGHVEAARELRFLAAAHPLRERVIGLLMLALHGDDRTGEALATYRDFRLRVTRELGIEPSLRLRDLHQRILMGETDDPRRSRVVAHGPVRWRTGRGPRTTGSVLSRR